MGCGWCALVIHEFSPSEFHSQHAGDQSNNIQRDAYVNRFVQSVSLVIQRVKKGVQKIEELVQITILRLVTDDAN